MSDALRIGQLADAAGTTPRTVRYYEEIGLLPGAGRVPGRHRTYTNADVERLRELLRLKELLGVSLEELRELVEVERSRAALRAAFHASESEAHRHEILEQALPLIERQLELVRRRAADLRRLEGDLVARRRRVRALLRGAGEPAGGPVAT